MQSQSTAGARSGSDPEYTQTDRPRRSEVRRDFCGLHNHGGRSRRSTHRPNCPGIQNAASLLAVGPQRQPSPDQSQPAQTQSSDQQQMQMQGMSPESELLSKMHMANQMEIKAGRLFLAAHVLLSICTRLTR